MSSTSNKFHSFKSEVKQTLSLSIPLVASNLVYALSGFIGTALVAQLGEDALAASVLVSMVWMSLSVLFFGLLNSISVLVAHQFGARNNQGISVIMGQSYKLGVIVTCVMVLVLCSMPYFLRFSEQSPAVQELAHQYMTALLWTIPGLIILIIHEQFLAGIGHTKLVLRISFIVVPVEIPLIYLLIFGKFGFPQCGVAGIGYGFAITYTVTAFFLTLYLLKSKAFKRYAIFHYLTQFDWKYLKELILVGLPIGFMHVIEVSTFTVGTFWIAHFGTTFLAAHQIVMQYLGFVITLVFSMSQAVTIRVGHAVGRQDLMAVRQTAYVGMLLNFFCALILAAAFYFIPTLFLRLDIDLNNPTNAALVRDASLLLSISAVSLLFDNFRIVGFGALRGLKDTYFPMYCSLIAFWGVGLISAYILAFKLNWSGSGVWWGFTIGIACGAIMVLCRLQWLLHKINLSNLLPTASAPK